MKRATNYLMFTFPPGILIFIEVCFAFWGIAILGHCGPHFNYEFEYKFSWIYLESIFLDYYTVLSLSFLSSNI